MSQNPGLAFDSFLPHKTTQKSNVLEVSQKKSWIQDPLKGAPQGFKSNPCCRYFAAMQLCRSISAASSAKSCPLENGVFVWIHGQKMHVEMVFQINGSPLQHFLLKCEKLVCYFFRDLRDNLRHQVSFSCSNTCRIKLCFVVDLRRPTKPLQGSMAA